MTEFSRWSGAARTTGSPANIFRILEGCQKGRHGLPTPRLPCPAICLPFREDMTTDNGSGGVATLKPRLLSGIPPACNQDQNSSVDARCRVDGNLSHRDRNRDRDRNRIPSSIRPGGLAIAFGDIQRNRLACSPPLVPGMAVGTGGFCGLLEHPRHIAYGNAVNVQYLVSQGHGFSISIAIPIGIWILASQQEQSIARHIWIFHTGSMAVWLFRVLPLPSPLGWAAMLRAFGPGEDASD